MKLTESRIKEIILEEIQAMTEEEQAVQQQSQQKLQTDVANIEKFLPKIDNAKEYNELVKVVMQHNFGNDNQKKVVLKQLKDLILNMLSK